MSDGNLKPGDGLLIRGFKDHVSPTLVLTYSAPKEAGRYHLALWLGTWKDGDADVDTRLNHLGWVFDPKRAKKLRAAQAMSAGTAKTEGLGAQPASAVAESDASNPGQAIAKRKARAS